jgi:trimeric autotransporter adhesin
MKRISSTIVALAALCLVAAPAGAVVPETLTYSGHLVDDGMPYEGTVDLTFELFDEGVAGSLLWDETHTSVEVSDGLFTAELGSLESISSLLDGGVYWLQVTIDTETLAPRTPFRSVPYALRAGDADTLEGQSADDIQNGATPGGNQVGYDNGSSGLTSTNMQDVVDELLARIEALESENEA